MCGGETTRYSVSLEGCILRLLGYWDCNAFTLEFLQPGLCYEKLGCAFSCTVLSRRPREDFLWPLDNRLHCEPSPCIYDCSRFSLSLPRPVSGASAGMWDSSGVAQRGAVTSAWVKEVRIVLRSSIDVFSPESNLGCLCGPR